MTPLNTIIEEEISEFMQDFFVTYEPQKYQAYPCHITEFQEECITEKLKGLLTSRDTYWKRRVGEAVKAERDRIAEVAIEIAIKRVQDVLCNYADDNIEDEKLNRIWFKAVVKKALTPITNEDN